MNVRQAKKVWRRRYLGRPATGDQLRRAERALNLAYDRAPGAALTFSRTGRWGRWDPMPWDC